MPMDDDARLEVLELRIGEWDVESFAGEERVAWGRHTNEWILDRKFQLTRGSLKTAGGSNDFDILAVTGLEPDGEHIHTWNFLSNGMVSEALSTWNAEDRTFRQVTRYGPVEQVSISHFENRVERWHIVNRDAEGNVMSEMRGTNTKVS